MATTTTTFACPCCGTPGCACSAIPCIQYIPSTISQQTAFFIPKTIFIDAAEFTSGFGVDCSAGDGTYACCNIGQQSPGTIEAWSYSSGGFSILIKYDDTTSTWTIIISFACTGGTATYTYTASLADFNGCGSVVTNSGTHSGECACLSAPETIVMRSDPDDPGNCACPCLLDCSNPFPTVLCVKFYNFSGGTRSPTDVFTMALNFPDTSIGFAGPSCVAWGQGTMLPHGTSALSCHSDGTVTFDVTYDITLRGGATNQPCSGCPAIFTGISNAFLSGETFDMEFSCEPCP